MGVQAICSKATKICQDATLTPPSPIECQSESFKPENKQREHQAIDKQGCVRWWYIERFIIE